MIIITNCRRVGLISGIFYVVKQAIKYYLTKK